MEYDSKQLRDPIYDVILISRQHLSNPHLGISRAVEQISEILSESGLQVCIITEGLFKKEVKFDPHLTIITVPSKRFGIRSMFLMRLPHPSSDWLFQIQGYLNQGRVAISPVVGLQLMVFRKNFPSYCKKIITLYTPYSKYSILGRLFFALQKQNLKSADVVVGNSKTVLQKFKLEQSERVIVIPNLNSLPKVSSSLNHSNKCDLVWIGALTLRKGVDRLIHFLILNKGLKSVQVIWSEGKFSLLPLKILRNLEKRGWCELRDNISDEDLSCTLTNTKALLSTTRFESFGMTLVEAASHGRGTIGIRAPGVSETLPESSNAAVYFERVREMLNYVQSSSFEERALILGSNAQSYTNLKYNKETISRLWNNLIDKSKPISYS